MRIVELKYPPPFECQGCGKRLDLYATRIGWRCWNCLPDEDLANEDGIKYKEPEISRRERKDLRDIRERLGVKKVPKKRGRPALADSHFKPSD